MKRLVPLVIGFLLGFGLLSGCFEIGRAHADGSGSAVMADAGSGSAVDSSPHITEPQMSDVGRFQKLWKDGSLTGCAILLLYVGLFAAAKIDKKHAFYFATGLGGLTVLIEALRRGDTPSVATILHTLAPTVAIMVAGPNHVKAPATSS